MKEPAAIRVGGWRVWLPDAGGAAEAAAWVGAAEQAVTGGPPLHRSKHAETYRWPSAAGDVYVKVYRRYRRRTYAKDLVRVSKARNALRLSRKLAASGFRVPRILAVGEERLGPWLRRSWVATAALEGEPLADHIAALHRRAEAEPAHARGISLPHKRALLRAVGTEVAHLHAAGFVAGDLVPANVWTATAPDGIRIALLDHDRTRAGRAPAPWWRARRNLVQLNRVVLPGVMITDRLRVYRAYASGRGWSWPAARRRLLWVVDKTIERRRRFDGVDLPRHVGVSFRELMRAGGPYAPGLAAPSRVRQYGTRNRVRCDE